MCRIRPDVRCLSVHLPHAHESSCHAPWHCHAENGRLAARSLEYNAPLEIYRHATVENEPHLRTKRPSTWHVSVSLSADTTADAPLSDVWSKHCVALLGFSLEKIPASFSRLRTVWSEILCACSPGIYFIVAVAIVVRLWRWCTQMYQVERQWLLCDDLIPYSTDGLSGDAKLSYHKVLTCPCFNHQMALLLWADVNLGTISLPTVSLCSHFEWVMMWPFIPHQGGFGMQSYRTSWCTCISEDYVYANRTCF